MDHVREFSRLLFAMQIEKMRAPAMNKQWARVEYMGALII